MLLNSQPKVTRTVAILALSLPHIMARAVSSIGCYSDSGSSPILNGIPSQNLSPPFFDPTQIFFSCQQFCGKHQFPYIGIQEGKMCTCGNTPPNKSVKVGEGNCDIICQDNGKENCGGYGYTSIFTSNAEQASTTETTPNSWENPTIVSNPSPTPTMSSSQRSPHSTTPNGSLNVAPMPATFIDNTGVMAAVFTLAGVVLLGCGILGFVLYQQRQQTTEYDLTSDEGLQTSYLWQRRSSLSLRDDVDYTKKLRVTNPDML
ncbi:Xylosyltransferase 2 [Basidiobolus ranarum]|uniref:Xylosyltransferase 2 n=1 Tax=Basidiobolus ranarum TaxID=34480 RepID=A0ABR2W468_9FUNG